MISFSRELVKSALTSILLVGLLAGCAGFARTEVFGPTGEPLTLDRLYFDSHANEAEGADDETRLPLERALADSGYVLVDRVIFNLQEGEWRAFDWEKVADVAWLLADGRIAVGDEIFNVDTITANTIPDLALVKASIMDLAPTAAQALGLRPPSESQGSDLGAPQADHVLLLFLDGFGYQRYQHAQQEGLIPNLASLENPLMGVTTYPPITTVSTASLLTGAPPDVHGADRRGIRQTTIETLFDVAQQSGLQVSAVEGEALAFQLRGAEFKLSGDRNQNGITDDDVLQNALGILREDVPDLFLVHFHGIDDAGHACGPGSAEESQAVTRVDAAVGELLAAMPKNSFILIFADHGMHLEDEAGRHGNHGHLIPADMLIPIIMVSK